MPGLTLTFTPSEPPCIWLQSSAAGVKCGKLRLYYIVVILLLLPNPFSTLPMDNDRTEADCENSAGAAIRVEEEGVISLWPGGVIPYKLEFDDFSAENRAEYTSNIHAAMGWWESNTCVQFQPCSNDTNTSCLDINIMEGHIGCWAFTGYDKKAEVRLRMTCISDVGGIAHELGHVLGLLDEQVRDDRDGYITVNVTNIRCINRYRYIKPSLNYSFLATPYDLGSIMHYPPYNGDAINTNLPVLTVRDRIAYHGEVGEMKRLSRFDVKAANFMYECNEIGDETETIHSGDTLAFKSLNTSRHQWIRCLDGDQCYSHGCPGANFNPGRHCPDFKFTITPVDYPLDLKMTAIRSGDRIVLKQYSFVNYSYIPLQCSGPSQLCSASNDSACFSYLWDYPPASDCQQQVFQIFAVERSMEEPIRHKDHIVLMDDADQSPSRALFCNTHLRKWQRTCQIENCSGMGMENCIDPRHSFTAYKLTSDTHV